jgi:Rieske [2Fe-2S] domain
MTRELADVASRGRQGAWSTSQPGGLVTAGVVAAVPTAAAGLNDWSDTAGPQTRVGLVHAAVNTTALSLYLASLVARARGRRRGGQALALAGQGMLLGGRYLGGHLCFVLGVEVNRTAWEQPPQQWTPVLADGELRKADAGGVPVPLYRTDGTVYALASTCTHMGGPLQESTSAMAASSAHGPTAPSGSPMAASCAARPARQSLATRRASRTGVSRSAPSHRRCGPQPSARVVTEDTVLRASNGPDRRGCSITERRVFARRRDER